ncbi:uncharacterized protein N7479_007317 [Penicillium vulpinum]|uniref:uncharacterized protein n=1 Tax=Penicillium vulpinum TaxID=29845 RepID=UPI002546B847|nr:uncharacterized protein N7479_007317 [Penicillium vulpinum]KAJ5960167.1 hypothetical protein N7479_007317 [Penicillium vulpinum]
MAEGAILGLKVKDTKMTRDLEEQNQDMDRLLINKPEPEWIESSVNPQHMANHIGPWKSMPSQYNNKLRESREQNAQLRLEMEKQKKTIAKLKKNRREGVAEFEKHMSRTESNVEKETKKIADLEYQKRMLVRDLEERKKKIADLECEKRDMIRDFKEQKKQLADLEREQGNMVHLLEEQTRMTSSLERRNAKMKDVLGNIASTMFSELEYQEELISEMRPDNEEFFQPSHQTLVDLVENLEQWTADDKRSDMMFDLEEEPQFEQTYAELLSQFNEQVCKLDMQSQKLDIQKSMIDQQASTMSELEAQKRKIASDLEEQNWKVALFIDWMERVKLTNPLLYDITFSTI